MIPPTSIDGTDITGATIDGTDVTEITVDGQTVFTAGPTIIDNFEPDLYQNASATLSTYYTEQNSGDLNAFSLNQSTVFEGTQALEATINEGIKQRIFSLPGDGLPNYPSQGDTFTVSMFLEGTDRHVFHFGCQDTNNQNNYGVEASVTAGGLIIKYDNGSRNSLTPYNVNNLPSGFVTAQIDWSMNGDITVEFYQNNSFILSITTNDTDYSSGGIGYGGDFNTGGETRTYNWDNVKII